MPIVILLSLLVSTEPITRGTCRPPERASDPTLPALYALDNKPFDWEMEPYGGGNGLKRFNVRFPSPVVTPSVENNTVHAELFVPDRPGRFPLVIVLHIAGGDFPLARFAASNLAYRNVAALFIKLPYYGERRPKTGKVRMISSDLERGLASMRQAVLDIRQACDWAQSQPFVDADRLGIMGISLGAIIGGLSSAIEPRLTHACLVMGAADLQHVLYDSAERDAHVFREAWEKVGGTRESFGDLVRPYNTATYGERFKQRIVLLVSATNDEVIPRPCNDALWLATGRQRNVWYPCGHYSMVWYLLSAVRQANEFFAAWPLERLAPLPLPPPSKPRTGARWQRILP